MNTSNFIVVLVGVCGTGKSAVGEQLAKRLGVPFFDADQLNRKVDLPHYKLPQDEDMDNWLDYLRKLIIEQSQKKGCVISCSVLSREHRRSLTNSIDQPLDWVFMRGSYEYALERAQKEGRQTRPVDLLIEDFEKLEVPKRALTIDMNDSEAEMVRTILRYMARKYW